MQDDLSDKVLPGTALDVILIIYRVAEVLAVGANSGRTIGWEAQTVAVRSSTFIATQSNICSGDLLAAPANDFFEILLRKIIMERAIFTFILATSLTASAASAASAQSSAAPAAVPSGHGEMMQGGMMQSDMMEKSEAMQAHQQKMEEMRALMVKAHAATNPAERKRLMAEHHQMMQAQMAIMMKGDSAAMMQACHERMMMMHDMMKQMMGEQEMMSHK